MMQRSVLDDIATEVEAWGDGWYYAWNPDDRGRRGRLTRLVDDGIRIDLEMTTEGGQTFLHAGCSVRMRDGQWEAVSVSLRNPVTKKALDHINQRLDALEASGALTDTAKDGRPVSAG